MPIKTSWIGTRVDWRPLGFGQTGRITLMPFRKERLPWYHEKYLIVAVVNTDLILVKTKIVDLDRLPKRINPTLAFMTLKQSDFILSWCAEFFDWPMAQALYEGYTLMPMMQSYSSQHWLHDAVLRTFHKHPVPGWTPVHRGVLGISFLRDTTDGEKCIEITSDACILRQGPIEENEALREHKIITRWNIHEMDHDAMTARMGDPEDSIQSRLIMRKLQQAAYEWILQNEMPF